MYKINQFIVCFRVEFVGRFTLTTHNFETFLLSLGGARVKLILHQYTNLKRVKNLTTLHPWSTSIMPVYSFISSPIAVIGAYDNTRIVIRRCIGCTEAYYLDVPDVVSDQEYRRFWITFDNGLIEIGRHGQVTPLASWQDMIGAIPVRYISFSSWLAHTGDWILHSFCDAPWEWQRWLSVIILKNNFNNFFFLPWTRIWPGQHIHVHFVSIICVFKENTMITLECCYHFLSQLEKRVLCAQCKLALTNLHGGTCIHYFTQSRTVGHLYDTIKIKHYNSPLWISSPLKSN